MKKSLVLISILIVMGFVVGCSNPCSNKVINTQQLVTENLIAYKIQRNCGITTAYSYHLTILKDNKKINDNSTGNVFISKSDFDYEWTKDNKLLIKYTEKSMSSKKENSINGIEVVYETF